MPQFVPETKTHRRPRAHAHASRKKLLRINTKKTPNANTATDFQKDGNRDNTVTVQMKKLGGCDGCNSCVWVKTHFHMFSIRWERRQHRTLSVQIKKSTPMAASDGCNAGSNECPTLEFANRTQMTALLWLRAPADVRVSEGAPDRYYDQNHGHPHFHIFSKRRENIFFQKIEALSTTRCRCPCPLRK